MRPLRYFRWWQFLGWGIVAVVIYLSLTSRPFSVPFSFSDKLGHFLAYAVLMGWFVQLYQSRTVLVVHALLLVALGVALEFLQDYRGRQFEYADMVANSMGVLCGLGLLFTPLRTLLLQLEKRLPGRN